jgi:uncharacterized membrane protein
VPWHYAVIGTLLLIGTVWAVKPDPQPAVAAAAPATFAEVQGIVAQRCVMCHGPAMQSKNVRFDSADEIAKHAQAIYQQAVVLKIMPMNNATQITDAERALIGRWYQAGAPK